MTTRPLTFCEKIGEAVTRYDYERRPVLPGRVEVSLDLYGLLLHEMRHECRFVHQLSGDAQATPMKIRGWPVHPVGDMKPLEWSLVPA
jgi:hypothetical protein